MIRTRLQRLRPRRARSQWLDQVADGLEIPQPFDLSTLCDRIARKRARALYIRPLPAEASADLPCGVWLGTDSADLVFYQPAAENFLKIHIILHEISHMLLGHVSPELASPGPVPVSHETPRTGFAPFTGRTTGKTAEPPARSEPPVGLFPVSPTVSQLLRANAELTRSSAHTHEDVELGLSTDRLLGLLGRSGYSCRQERDAELLATIILERASRNERRPVSRRAEPVLTRLNEALGHPVRSI
ncbi:hypothetical protein ADL21_00860 [Streptomyces albus subsp. albus]|nr:hypothetical protein ADL21_00860 [Streptomyces albus subsp. albus]